jgi:zinc transport system substrate-binding protein
MVLIEFDNRFMKTRGLCAVALTTVASLALSACGLGGAPDPGDGRQGASRLAVVASFYPLQFAAAQIGGDHVVVTSLTKPGVEPHDLELQPRDIATLSKAKLVIYESGLQVAVDKALESQGAGRVLDVLPAANLNRRLASGGVDPHFWLDPVRYSGVATVIAERLSSVDPANKAEYANNAKVFAAKLALLDRDFSAGLANCQRRDIVTSHSAFGYLADRFDMKQISISGLSPDQEPKAAELAAVSRYAKVNGVTTIYAETLVSPAIARTVARESGARMATLDPVEGLTDSSSGKDYFEVMRSNLKTLRAGQSCS